MYGEQLSAKLEEVLQGLLSTVMHANQLLRKNEVHAKCYCNQSALSVCSSPCLAYNIYLRHCHFGGHFKTVRIPLGASTS